MLKIKDLKQDRAIPSATPFVAALGDFDGVHLGHRRVIAEALSLANEQGVASACWHLASSPKTHGAYLTCDARKEEIFASLGVDFSLTEDFEAVRDMSPEEFVLDYLVRLGCRGVVCGYNFRFGRGAAGDAGELEARAGEAGIVCRVVDEVALDGDAVSSTRIREALAAGDAATAARLLGEPYTVRGTVEHGRNLGHSLGFPTVNQNFAPGQAIPRHGVYYTTTKIDGRVYPSVSNVGSRPTVGGHACRIETHILGEDGDFYGKTLDVSLIEFRRDEVSFGSREELVRAIAEDKAACAEYFKNFGKGD